MSTSPPCGSREGTPKGAPRVPGWSAPANARRGSSAVGGRLALVAVPRSRSVPSYDCVVPPRGTSPAPKKTGRAKKARGSREVSQGGRRGPVPHESQVAADMGGVGVNVWSPSPCPASGGRPEGGNAMPLTQSSDPPGGWTTASLPVGLVRDYILYHALNGGAVKGGFSWPGREPRMSGDVSLTSTCSRCGRTAMSGSRRNPTAIDRG